MNKQLLESLIQKHQGQILSTKSVYRGKFLGINESRVKLSNGKTIIREQIVKNNGYTDAVIILPITAEDDVILTVQPRTFVPSGVGIGVPAGYVDSGEEPLKAAIRELREETGYTSNEFVKVAEYYQDSGCSDALITCYIAYNAYKVGEQDLDGDEFIDLFTCKVSEVGELIDNGVIKSASTQVTYNELLRRRSRNEDRCLRREL